MERELLLKLGNLPNGTDMRNLKISKKCIIKIAKIYFENIAGNIETETAQLTNENLSN